MARKMINCPFGVLINVTMPNEKLIVLNFVEANQIQKHILWRFLLFFIFIVHFCREHYKFPPVRS